MANPDSRHMTTSRATSLNITSNLPTVAVMTNTPRETTKTVATPPTPLSNNTHKAARTQTTTVVRPASTSRATLNKAKPWVLTASEDSARP